jgi:hypothetical protein
MVVLEKGGYRRVIISIVKRFCSGAPPREKSGEAKHMDG